MPVWVSAEAASAWVEHLPALTGPMASARAVRAAILGQWESARAHAEVAQRAAVEGRALDAALYVAHAHRDPGPLDRLVRGSELAALVDPH